MTRKSKITKRELAAVLRESVSAINSPGPLRVIVDVGDTRYYVQRATELLALVLESPTPQQQVAYLGDAILLLGVAKHLIRDYASTLKESPRRVKPTEIGGTFTLQHNGFETEPIPYHSSATVIEKALDAAREKCYGSYRAPTGGTFVIGKGTKYETKPIPHNASPTEIDRALAEASKVAEDKERHMV